jgi:uncharacterized membrane protein YcaP (DUF421 family)
MDSVVRITIIYFFLLIIFRISGKRTLAESTPFDMVVLLIIGDLVQEAVVDSDHSLTNCILVVTTLMLFEITLTMLKFRSEKVDAVIDGLPLILVNQGRVLKDRLDKAKVKEEDIIEAGRVNHGLERMDQIKYAVLEARGEISIVPFEK